MSLSPLKGLVCLNMNDAPSLTHSPGGCCISRVRLRVQVDDFRHYLFTPRDLTALVVGLLRYDVRAVHPLDALSHEVCSLAPPPVPYRPPRRSPSSTSHRILSMSIRVCLPILISQHPRRSRDPSPRGVPRPQAARIFRDRLVGEDAAREFDGQVPPLPHDGPPPPC